MTLKRLLKSIKKIVNIFLCICLTMREHHEIRNNTVTKVESDVPYRNDTESGNEDNIQFKYNAETDDLEARPSLRTIN